MNLFIEHPWDYLISRVQHPSDWRNRKILFKQRQKWDVSNWESALNIGECWSDKDCKSILLFAGDMFGISWKKLRPEDRLEVELCVPCDTINGCMLGDFYSLLEYKIMDRRDWDEDDFPEPPFDPSKVSLGKLIAYSLRILSGVVPESCQSPVS